MTKEEIISGVNSATATQGEFESYRDWYDTFYALKVTFSMEELESMSEKELNNLFDLADKNITALLI